jgi:hypothetical protein
MPTSVFTLIILNLFKTFSKEVLLTCINLTDFNNCLVSIGKSGEHKFLARGPSRSAEARRRASRRKRP